MASDLHSAYWNHNPAFHDEILRKSSATSGAVLDVGCGDGLLLARMARTGRPVVGIEPDSSAANLARQRCTAFSNVGVVEADFLHADLDRSSFGFVTMIATLHHMDTRAALSRAADMLNTGGVLYVLGLTRIETRRDLAFAIGSLPRARIVGALRGERWAEGVPVAEPPQTFAQVRKDTEAVLMGARLRRRPYYRFSLEWTKSSK